LILKDIEQINKKNIENLKIKESELKSIEDDIKKKKNIISKDEFENEVIRLRQNIKKFKNYKNKLVSEIENKKNNDIKEFFTKVNPIIQNYMDNNSIDILLERKNVFMSKNSSDITEKLIIEINKKFK
jgi:Skp family chaperone for outer membrane proteins